MVKTLRSHCRGVQVQSLAGELKSHMPHGTAEKPPKQMNKQTGYFFFLQIIV